MEKTSLTNVSVPQSNLMNEVSHQHLYKIATFCLLALLPLVAGGAFFVGKTGSTPTVAEYGVSSTPSPTLLPEVNQEWDEGRVRDLATILKGACINHKVAVQSLPVIFSEKIFSKYQMNNDLWCDTEETYASGAEEYSASVNDNQIFVFNEQSFMDGPNNVFDDSESLPILLNQKEYILKIEDIGPYGMSDKGIWVYISADKESPESNIKIRSQAFRVLRTSEMDKLVQQFGSPFTITSPHESDPKYTVDRDKIDNFRKAFKVLGQKSGTQTNTDLLEMAASVDEDLEGSEFR